MKCMLKQVCDFKMTQPVTCLVQVNSLALFGASLSLGCGQSNHAVLEHGDMQDLCIDTDAQISAILSLLKASGIMSMS